MQNIYEETGSNDPIIFARNVFIEKYWYDLQESSSFRIFFVKAHVETTNF